MFKHSRTALTAALIGTGVLASPTLQAQQAAPRDYTPPPIGEPSTRRLECSAFDAAGNSLSAHYVEQTARTTFQVNYKTPDSAALGAGDTVAVTVDEVEITTIPLVKVASGKATATLHYDSMYDYAISDMHADNQPFPANWPLEIRGEPDGTRVTVNGLECRLGRER